ncbi:MAG TPA: plastocyanin/azurin family copper-binding protein [Actinomycetota bacterium]|nr:plastocyanin/azurin family copper-binding protein [Actinomycetota bacterium]
MTLVALAGCSAEPPAARRAEEPAEAVAQARREKKTEPAREPERVDPRKRGLEIVLGEWALTPESHAIRPGRVTFVVRNRGTMAHGFEMELEGDSSGHGSGDLFEAEGELLQPGETARMTVTLGPGLYEIECLVDGHDDMGMEGVLEVSADAPLVRSEAPARPGRISIAEFAFDPSPAVVPAGTEVVWTNNDPADHTVTSADGSFGSDSLGTGESFSHRFDEQGTYEYKCAIHPEMVGRVRVE